MSAIITTHTELTSLKMRRFFKYSGCIHLIYFHCQLILFDIYVFSNWTVFINTESCKS